MTKEALTTREAFERDGFAGPFRALTADAAATFATRIEREVLTHDGPDPKSRAQSRHLDHRIVYALCTAPPILAQATALLGEDVVLWRSHLFVKAPGDPTLDWHRDRNHWRSIVSAPRIVSAWLALDRAHLGNGCVRVIPQSARCEFAPKDRDPRSVEVPPEDTERARAMELEPGEFFLFDQHLIHGSSANPSAQRRLGLAIRFLDPSAHVDHDALFWGHACVLVRGHDTYGRIRLTEPPRA